MLSSHLPRFMSTPLRSRRRRSGFTLIELLTVMAIIVILAGLILGTAGYANRRAASSRTQAEIKAIEGAINNYQVDNGTVPRDRTATDRLDARMEASQGGNAGTSYQTASLYLFRALSGYYDMSGATPALASNQKVYFPWKPAQIFPATAAAANGTITPASVKYVLDPFGQSYGYSTIGAAQAEAAASTANAGTPPPVQTQGFNPTFDLWSTGGYGPGKPYPSGSTDKSTFWITNWSGQ